MSSPICRAYPDACTIDHWAAPDGWPLRRFRWSQPAGRARGAMLLLTGRGDMFEKYLESFAHFHAAGWDLASFDWRGQGGSGRIGAQSLDDGDFAVLVEDLAAFYRQWATERAGPHVVIGHSMGGHLLMRGLAGGLFSPDAAVLIAPMLGMNSRPIPARLGAWIARAMCALGASASPAWKEMEKPGVSAAARKSLLTHSAERYADELFWHREMPELKLGPPTWHWLDTAYRSLAMIEVPGTLEGVRTPLLILAAEEDRLVDTRAIRRAASRIDGCRLHVYGDGTAHEILREADPVRSDALARIDAFLDEVTPRS